MKKIIISTAILFCFLKADAQEFSISFKAGQNFSHIAGNDTKQTIPGINREITPESKSGFTGGISLGYEFLPMFSVQLEAIYAKKGAVYQDQFSLTSALAGQVPPQLLPFILGLFQGANDEVKFKGDFTGDYLEVPLLFAFSPNLGIPLKPSVYIGPNFAFLMNQSQEVTYEGELLDTQLPIPIPLPVKVTPRDLLPPVYFGLKDFDMGFTFGGGLQYDILKTASFGVEGRYTIGFKSAVDSVGFGPTSFAGVPLQEGSTQKDPDIKNRSLSIMAILQYKF